MFKTNVGTIDRIARVAIGLALLSLTVTGPHSMWGLIGVIPIATAIFSICPLYSMLGISTCPAKR